jgi:hypothetical protein
VTGGTLQRERYQHQVQTGKFGMGLAIYGSSNVIIEGVTARDNWETASTYGLRIRLTLLSAQLLLTTIDGKECRLSQLMA